MSSDRKEWVGLTLSGGRYRVDAKLGEGGMGFVYKALDQSLDTDVVVKVPRRSMLEDPEFSRRFALEIRSLVKLSHPNIVKISDVGEYEGLPFAVLQYLSGGTLEERQGPGRIDASSLARWLPGVAAALDFIHKEHYIHRDVKPANILFDAHGHAFLSDFGVAKVISDVEASARRGSAMTGMGMVLGTPEYMAPELIMGGKFDGRVDQYALAVTAYEILCGRRPFTGETPTAIVVRQTTEEPPPMPELPATGSEAIARVILKGMAKKPEARFRSCGEFASNLVAALSRSAAQPVPGRLSCPTCSAGFATPDDLSSVKGKKTRCPSCGALFRFADDGLSLTHVDPAPAAGSSRTVLLPTPGSPASAPSRSGSTRKLDAVPDPLAPPPSGRTTRLEAIPGTPRIAPDRASRTVKLEAKPGAGPAIEIESTDRPSSREDQPARSSPIPWPWAAGIAGAVGLAALVLIWFVTWTPKQGTVQIRLASLPGGASLSIDGESIDPDRLKKPMTLPIGPHRLDAEAPGFAPYQADLTIVSGANPAFPVRMKPLPKPRPVAQAPVIEAPSTPPPTIPKPPPPILIARPNPELSMAPAAAPLASTDSQPPAPTVNEAEPPPIAPMTSSTGAAAKTRRNGTKEADPVPIAPDRKGAASSEAITLKSLVNEPERYLDRFISPTELLTVNTQFIGGRRGSEELAARSREGETKQFQRSDASFRLVMKPGLAANVREQINKRNLVEGEYFAMMKLKVVKDSSKESAFLGVVEWLEFLFFTDPRGFAFKTKLYNKAFHVVNVTDAESHVGISPSYEEWRKRLAPTKILTHLGIEYSNAFFAKRDQQLDAMFKQVQKDASAASKVLQEQQQQMIRNVWGPK